jgi:large subunit ribosomal protein L13
MLLGHAQLRPGRMRRRYSTAAQVDQNHWSPLALTIGLTAAAAAIASPALNPSNRHGVVRMPSPASRTFSPRARDITRDWYVVDADGQVLGRLAAQVARILRGKHKPIFAPHVDAGDHVIVVNAAKVRLTGRKREQKVAYRHSGYPGGLKAVPYTVLLEQRPSKAVERAVRGMLPRNRLGRQMLSKLKVYDGPTHPHAAQMPRPLDLTEIRQQG